MVQNTDQFTLPSPHSMMPPTKEVFIISGEPQVHGYFEVITALPFPDCHCPPRENAYFSLAPGLLGFACRGQL